jgi:hypothetical protein
VRGLLLKIEILSGAVLKSTAGESVLDACAPRGGGTRAPTFFSGAWPQESAFSSRPAFSSGAVCPVCRWRPATSRTWTSTGGLCDGPAFAGENPVHRQAPRRAPRHSDAIGAFRRASAQTASAELTERKSLWRIRSVALWGFIPPLTNRA